MDVSIPTDIFCCRCLQLKCRCVITFQQFFPLFFRDIETERKWEVSCSSITLTETSNFFSLSIVLQLL